MHILHIPLLSNKEVDETDRDTQRWPPITRHSGYTGMSYETELHLSWKGIVKDSFPVLYHTKVDLARPHQTNNNPVTACNNMSALRECSVGFRPSSKASSLSEADRQWCMRRPKCSLWDGILHHCQVFKTRQINGHQGSFQRNDLSFTEELVCFFVFRNVWDVFSFSLFLRVRRD